MERLDMAEQLSGKANVTLGEAKSALERADWDMLEAMIILQKEKGKAESGEKAGRAMPQADAGWLARAVSWVGDVIARGNRNFIAVSRDGSAKFELTATVAVLLALVLHGFFFFGVVVMLLMDYRFKFISETQDKAYRKQVQDAGAAAREVNDRLAVNSFGESA